MVIMGNDGHVPALSIHCGFASVSHAVACERCERLNASWETEFFIRLIPPATRGVSITGTDLSDALL